MVPPIHAKATAREWIGLAVLALPCLIYAMDLTVLMLAVPHLTADLKPSASQLLWITDIYGFLIAGLLITMGTLGDRIGRKRLLLIGAAAFGVGSVLAAFAPTAELLIVARALLGVAGATLAPSTLSLIRNMFHDEKQRVFAIGIWVSSFSAGGALGPLFGGVLLEHFWWGSVFLVALPVMALLLAVGPFLLPESKDPNAGKLEIISALLSLGAVLPIIFGIKKIAEHGFEWSYLVFIMAGFLIGAAFVRRQKRLDDPLIDVSLFTVPGFAPALLINVMGLFMAFGFFLLSAQYLQLVLGMGPLEAGLWTAPTGLVFVIGSMMTPQLINHFRRVHIIAAGFVVAAIGLGFLTQVGVEDSLGIFMTGMLLFCLGIAPIGTITTDMVMTIAPPERAGAASAISETSFETGGAIGIAVIGSLVTGYYRTHMAQAMPPGVAYNDMDTLGAAAQLAQSLPISVGGPLLESARVTFTDSMTLVAYICVLTSLMAAGIAMVLLRRYRVRP